MKPADTSNPSQMKMASEAFVARLLKAKGIKRIQVNAASNMLECGHDPKHGYRYGDTTLCRKCRANRAEIARARRLPEMIENTRRKLDGLEREARRRGQIT